MYSKLELEEVAAQVRGPHGGSHSIKSYATKGAWEPCAYLRLSWRWQQRCAHLTGAAVRDQRVVALRRLIFALLILVRTEHSQ